MSQVEDVLRRRLRESGSVTFAEFMEVALYGPGGYYARSPLPIGPGPDCDFATAPSLSPLFGNATARLLADLDLALGVEATVFEAGPGNGDHLSAVLAQRPRSAVAWDRMRRPLPAEVRNVEQLASVPVSSIDGLVFSCELFDALPVHRLVGLGGGETGELWVDLDSADEFVWRTGELSDPILVDLLGGETLEKGQVADVAPTAAPLYRELAGRLDRGCIVTCDYGFERPALFDARIRRHGTLACHRRHGVHRNPFVFVGDQDLTAWVDFTALRETGEALGLQTIGLFRLAEWLVRLDIFEDLQECNPTTRRGAIALLDPEGLGHDQQVLVQSRGVPLPARLVDELRNE